MGRDGEQILTKEYIWKGQPASKVKKNIYQHLLLGQYKSNWQWDTTTLYPWEKHILKKREKYSVGWEVVKKAPSFITGGSVAMKISS